ncbi:hypothetical protein PZ897_14450 [Hoeflea sp. YIM 152468]|uniref:hypothetical protein n=1 Tax=Hoeflea sp. YIM 152468 TaxID=3031759 RepID=UPI0023DC6452|nr:hypothetical protein [Hoeflea sp. YIM 152468]MDF1609382.1 hypothetical protein [Hoeflea sp. YIM 152468]
MTSIKHRIGGYLKQIVGEVVGSQPLHDSGKREVLGLPEHTPADETTTSAAHPAAQAGEPLNPDPVAPKPAAGAGPSRALPEHGHQQKQRKVSVFTQMLPKIEQGDGALVKVASEDEVVYVAIRPGGTIQDARDIVVRMADRLTAEPEKAPVPDDAETADGGRSTAPADEHDDLADQLEIGLLDSFPASDPPAAATSTVLPKTYNP